MVASGDVLLCVTSEENEERGPGPWLLLELRAA